MALVCEHCGTAKPDNAYFCGKCGSQVRSAFDQPAGQGLTIKVSEPEAADPSQEPAATTPASPNRISAPPAAPQIEPSHRFALRDGPAPRPAASAEPGSVPIPPPPAYGQPVPPPGAYPSQTMTAFTPGYAPPPPDGNSSGMGSSYLPPGETQGWTFAGCVPAGLFGFINGSTLWGVLGLLGCFGVPLVSTVYAIYIGIKGKELAWQNRRFSSIHQFKDTMRAWNNWGIFWVVLSVIATILYFVLVISLGMLGALTEGSY